MAPPFAAVLFDCDGVLLDNEGDLAALWCDGLRACGAEIAIEEWLERYTGTSGWRAELEQRFAAHLAPGSLDAIAAREAEVLRTARAMPGIAAILEAIEVPIAVASSSRRERLLATLETAGLLPAFAGRVFSAWEVPRGKPAPDLFLHAAAALKVEPSRCAVVEDSVPGILAARAAGMTAIAFTGGAHITAATADRLARANPAHTASTSDALAVVLGCHLPFARA